MSQVLFLNYPLINNGYLRNANVYKHIIAHSKKYANKQALL